MHIREHFVGISKDRIQSFINRNREHCSKYCQVVLCLTHTKVKTKHFLKKFMSTGCVLILMPDSDLPKKFLLFVSLKAL